MSYRNKGKESFISRINIFLFKKVIENALLTLVNGTFDKIVMKEFLDFKLEDNCSLVEYFYTIYYQKGYDSLLEPKYGIKIPKNCSVTDVYNKLEEVRKKLKIKSRELNTQHKLFNTYFEDVFQKIYPQITFSEHHEKRKKIDSCCEYCGISVREIGDLITAGKIRNKRSDTRGYVLEIDRKEPNFEYKPGNIVLSCYWCNNAKTDEYSHNEFMQIGDTISKVWKARMKKDDLLTTIK